MVQIMAWRRPGDKPLSEPMMVCSTTQLCVTWLQWVNENIWSGLSIMSVTWYPQLDLGWKLKLFDYWSWITFGMYMYNIETLGLVTSSKGWVIIATQHFEVWWRIIIAQHLRSCKLDISSFWQLSCLVLLVNWQILVRGKMYARASPLVRVMACRLFGAKTLQKRIMWLFVSWDIRNTLKIWIENTRIFCQENALEIVFCKLSAILLMS